MSEFSDLVRDIDASVPPRLGTELRGFNLSDLGNSERLVARHGPDLRYVPGLSWHVWDGTRFARDDSGEVTRRMAETIRALYTEADLMEDAKERRGLVKFALDSEREPRIRAAVSLASADRSVVGRVEDLDRDPALLNVANGTLELRSGELRPHARGDLLTRITPIVVDPKATCPTWEGFLETIMAGDRQLVDFLQRAIGYSLTGSAGEQLLFLLHGPGANGKSTFVEVLRSLLGEYAVQAPAETFLERRGGGVPNDVARLRGARFVAAVEMPEGRRLDEVLVKRLTGGDRIAARFLHREFFEFAPIFKPWIATNHRPTVRGTDEAIWRRLRLVPFKVTIPKEERDPKLLDRLRDELPGILNWALAGCAAWNRGGLVEPAVVLEATASYRAEEDVLGGFLADCCALDPGARAKASELYTRYGYWAVANGEQTLTQTKFGRALAERGFEQERSRSARYWLGVGLLVEEGP